MDPAPSDHATAAALRRAAGLLVIFVTLCAGVAARAQDRSLEYAVKATYLYKFAPFVDFPAAVFASAASPFEICILGDSAFATLVGSAATGQTVDGHPFAVRRLPDPAEAGDCQILFLDGVDEATAAAAAAAVQGKPVLTVADRPAERPSAIIDFVVIDGRVRFSINLGAAARNGLAISSKLLSLAVSVQPAPGQRVP